MLENKAWIKKITVLICSLIFCLGLLEIIFRCKALIEDQQILAEDRLNKANLDKTQNHTLGDIIQISNNERIIYELRPNLDTIFNQTPLWTNSEGFRDKEYLVRKDEKTVRLIGIGDSIMFGWRILEKNSYLSVLEEMLNEHYPQKKWEIINTSVPGYNSWIEIDTLKEKGLKYKPDIVILGVCNNDTDLPNFIRKKENYLTFSKSFLKEFIILRLKNISRERKGMLLESPHFIDKLEFKRFENDPSKVPETYRYMIGQEGFISAMRELKKLSLEKKFKVVIVEGVLGITNESWHQLNNLDFYIVKNGSAIQKYMKNKGIQDYKDSVLSISARDPHPSPLAHRLIAQEILATMENNGLIQHFFNSTND